MTSDSPFSWSFPVGSLFQTRIRISFLMPLLFVVMFLVIREPVWAAKVCVILLASTLLHELFGHIWVARVTGGQGNEILLWPLGGLANVSPAPNFWSRFATAAGGPFVNLLLCMMTLPSVVLSEGGMSLLNPFILNLDVLNADPFGGWLLLIFQINFMLFLVNLLPAFPLDGGRMLEAVFRTQMEFVLARQISIRIGMACSFLLFAVGLIVEESWLAILASFVMVMNFWEQIRLEQDPYLGASEFEQYDFSEGYTSLEREEKSAEVSSSLWTQWKEKREQKKQIQEELALMEDEQTIDLLLEKIHRDGVESLSTAEKRALDQASARMKNRREVI